MSKFKKIEWKNVFVQSYFDFDNITICYSFFYKKSIFSYFEIIYIADEIICAVVVATFARSSSHASTTSSSSSRTHHHQRRHEYHHSGVNSSKYSQHDDRSNNNTSNADVADTFSVVDEPTTSTALAEIHLSLDTSLLSDAVMLERFHRLGTASPSTIEAVYTHTDASDDSETDQNTSNQSTLTSNIHNIQHAAGNVSLSPASNLLSYLQQFHSTDPFYFQRQCQRLGVDDYASLKVSPFSIYYFRIFYLNFFFRFLLMLIRMIIKSIQINLLNLIEICVKNKTQVCLKI